MSNKKLPTQARAVIVGGGIVGCSVAYHLTKLGWKDVVILEQGRLSSGTTWHAAGLVGQLRAQENMTRLIQYSTDLYESLEAETGLGTGWKRTGSIIIARTEERMTVLRRTAASAAAYGVEADVISAKEAQDIWPIMQVDDVVGGVWLPGDGKANPTDLTQALAKGARMGGAQVFEKTRVTGVKTKQGRAVGVQTVEGDIDCEVVINCAGQWARQFGRLAGVTVPLYSAEHMYIVTKQIDGVTPDLAVLRDPDGYIYCKEEVGGLVMGGFEPEAKPWGMDGIPDDFEFQLLPDDWEQFEILMENAIHRIPALETAEVRQFINGPESFTPDSHYILGEAPELANYYVGAGFNSMGIASAGGAGKALAEWIVNGQPTMDLWPVDIRRFARFQGNEKWLSERVSETLGTHYTMPWPNKEMSTARPFRRSPIYHLLAQKGACFGSKMGWERAVWFANADHKPEMAYSFGRQNWFDNRAAEHRATREAVAVFDQTSFSKFLVQGRDAEAVLQRICANNVAVEPGRCVYTGMLNERGGYESDLTVTRLADDKYFLVSGSAQTTRDLGWLKRHTPDDTHCVVTDMSSAYAVFGVMGPNARKLLSKITDADLDNAAFGFSTMQEIGVGYATVWAMRMTYVGELGWELYVPAEFAVGVYEEICAAGADLGLRDAGYYAMDSLRIEKGFRAWGHELTPDYTPFQAGLSFAVDFDKNIPFIGREALLAIQGNPLTKRLLQFTLPGDGEAILWGGELILQDAKPVGKIESGSYGHTLGYSIGLGYVHNEDGVDKSLIETGGFEIDVAGVRYPARAHLRTPYDPSSEKVKV